MTSHPASVVHPGARVDATVVIGPYAVIDEGVVIGPNCVVGPHVHLTGLTTIGASNQFHTGCVIGDAPQDLKYKGDPTRLRIGDSNVFREHVTVHRSNQLAEETRIGSHNFFMANCHIGHNCVIGDHVIIANGALLGGHVEVADRVFISGNCLIHQFVRIGTLAFMQGSAGIGKDLPPFTVARGINSICGLNTVGLRRAGVALLDRRELKRLYHLLFRRQGKFRDALAAARAEFTSATALALIDFVAASKRGVCLDMSSAEPEVESAADENV